MPIAPANRQTQLPDWVPPEGTFADIPARNTPEQAIPEFYDRRRALDPFIQWGGGAYAFEWGTRGAILYHSSGHLSKGTAVFQPVLCFDLDELRWHSINEPLKPNVEGQPLNEDGMFQDGTYYTPHTYLGLQYLPASWGGASPKGELLQFFHAGARIRNRVLRFDLSKKKLGVRKWLTIDFDGLLGTYPSTVMDQKRKGWWVGACYGTLWRMAFLNAKGEITYHDIPNNRSTSWLIDPRADVMIGVSDWDDANPRLQKVYVIDLAAPSRRSMVPLEITPGTPRPFPLKSSGRAELFKLGITWSGLLNCGIGYQGMGSHVVYKLLVPSDPFRGPYVLTHETLTPYADAVPASNGSRNGSWGRFKEVPALRSFFWADLANGKPQLFRPRGVG